MGDVGDTRNAPDIQPRAIGARPHDVLAMTLSRCAPSTAASRTSRWSSAMRDAAVAFGALTSVTVGCLALLVGAAVRLDAQAAGMRPSGASTACMVIGALAIGGAVAAWRAR